VTRTAFERTVTDYIYTHGPPSSHTRSRNRSHSTSSTTTPDQAPTTPSAGDLTRTRNLTRTLQRRAEDRLRSRRIKLLRYITSERSHDEYDNLDLRMPTHWLIEQLGTRDGDIDNLPRPPRATWDSDIRMISRRARRRARPSGLREVAVNYTEAELDGEFGVLPGETWAGDDEEHWEAEEDVVRGLTVDGNVFEAVMDGESAEGVWRRVVNSNVSGRVGGADETVVRWIRTEQKRTMRRVMGPSCVRIVRRMEGLKRT
jgi:hypothetical protein